MVAIPQASTTFLSLLQRVHQHAIGQVLAYSLSSLCVDGKSIGELF